MVTMDQVVLGILAGVLRQLPAGVAAIWEFARANPLTSSLVLAVLVLGGLTNARPAPARRR
jgi:hypothetical protein